MSARDGASTEILIVGGGLVGSLASIYLRRRGLDVTIYERFPDIRDQADADGRSINLVVASRGVRALEAVGLWDRVRDLTVPVTGRMMHSLPGLLPGSTVGTCSHS